MSRQVFRSDKAIGEIVEEELVLLQTETGQYFSLNSTGARIWQLLGESSDLGWVHEALTRAFPVDAEELRRDLNELVDELEAARLVRVEARDATGDR